MRKKQTYLLSILASEGDSNSIHGQIKEIATGKVYTFHNLDELNSLIASETHTHQVRDQKEVYSASPAPLTGTGKKSN